METKRGISVAPGVAIGPAFVLNSEAYRIPDRFIARGSHPDEISRFRSCLQSAVDEANKRSEETSESLGSSIGAIFTAHALMLEDPGFKQDIEAYIRDHNYTAEYSVSKVINKRVKSLASLKNDYFSARDVDLRDLEKLILHHLLGHRREPIQKLTRPVILLAQVLTPGEIFELDQSKILGIATEHGGRTSHSAIVAAGVLRVPVVFGLGSFTNQVSGGDRVVVDGSGGLLVLNPDEEALERYEHARRTYVLYHQKLEQLRDEPAVTLDAERVNLYGNIEFPEECAACLSEGCEGVGLYRTEFLYLGKDHEPTEAEHFDAYSTVVEKMQGRPIIIRTLDLGGDKFATAIDPEDKEKNPFLGVRSIRLCLRNVNLFNTQMRAILRASGLPGADVRIMFPMISTVRELRESKHILRNVMEDLEDEGIKFNRQIKIGTMIEVPSAALMASHLAKEVNFFSIGTNDLIQYTMAADRTNEHVADLYNPGEPAVLHLLKKITDVAKESGVEVSVCGEMCGEPLYTQLLIGLGIRKFSASPSHILEIKRLIRSIKVSDAEKIAAAALEMESARDVNYFLREQARKVLPEILDV